MYFNKEDAVGKISYINGGITMDVFNNAIRIEFPLRGEWQAPTTPVRQVPSHGTNRMGMSYAFDFVQVNWDKSYKPVYNASLIKYLISGVSLADCYDLCSLRWGSRYGY
jgi:hypothetical protein